MAKFETVKEDASVSKLYGQLPAISFDKVVELEGKNNNEKFTDLLKLYGGNMERLLAGAIDSYNQTVRATAGGTFIAFCRNARKLIQSGAVPGVDVSNTAVIQALAKTMQDGVAAIAKSASVATTSIPTETPTVETPAAQ